MRSEDGAIHVHVHVHAGVQLVATEDRCGLRACSNSSLTPGKSLAAPKYLTEDEVEEVDFTRTYTCI